MLLPHRVLFELLSGFHAHQRSQVRGLSFDGTSATAMLVDRGTGRVLTPAKLYNEAQSKEAVSLAKARL